MVEQEKLILYVDDDEDDREFLTAAVTTANPDIRVKTTENGLQALEFLNSSRDTYLPCLIVLDLNMPFLDGRETCRRIKADDVLKDVPLLIFSSSEKPEDKRTFNQLGIEYFTKPSHVEQIQKIARHMVSLCCR